MFSFVSTKIYKLLYLQIHLQYRWYRARPGIGPVTLIFSIYIYILIFLLIFKLIPADFNGKWSFEKSEITKTKLEEMMVNLNLLQCNACHIFSCDEQLKKWRCHFVHSSVRPFGRPKPYFSFLQHEPMELWNPT